MRKHLLFGRGMKALLLLIPLCNTWSSYAQSYNIAPVAITAAPNSGQRGDGIGANGPCWALNDGYVGPFPGTTFAGTIEYNGALEYTWTEQQTFNKIRFYNSASPLVSCIIEYDNGSGYQLLVNYSNSAGPNADSITFSPVTATKLRFREVKAAGKGEAPRLREIEVWHAPASGNTCPSTLTAGTVFPAEQTLCLGGQATVVAGSYSFSDDIIYQWQVNSSGSWQDIPGANNTWYSFRVTAATPADANYRLKVTCGGNTEYTVAPGRIRVSGGHNATYATVPYFEDFEASWINGCGTGDIPSASWTTTPTTGPHIWKSSRAFGPRDTPFPDAPNGTASARFGSSFSSATNYLGHLDLHVNCSAPSGDKLLYFYYVNQPDPRGGSYPDGNDVLTVLISRDAGASFEPLAVFTTQDEWGLKTVPIVSNSATTIIRFSGRTQTAPGSRDQSDLGIDSVYIAPPCTGSVTAGTVLPVEKICPGTTATLSSSGSSQGGGIHYQWEQSVNGTSGWVNAVGGNGSTAPVYQTPVLYTPIHYRLRVTCENGNDTKTTSAVRIDMDAPEYASIPFVENFEQWTKRCDTINEIPSKHWVNSPATGISSWRRDDEGNHPWGFTTQWNPSTGTFIFSDWNASNGKYDPIAFEGEHSARFHTRGNQNGIGKLDLFVDCSRQTGDKELSFALNLTKDIPATGNNPNPAPNGYDYLNVYLSTDGGTNFNLLEKFEGPAFSKWEIKSITFSSNSATTVIRFEAVSVSGYKDLGLDYVRILPTCTETPTAGTIDSVNPCLNTDFFLKLSGNSQAGNIRYQWQRATSASGPWINMPGTTSGIYTTQIQDTTWFRTIVTCIGSSRSDTTPVRKVDPSPFYYCYCASGFNSELTLNNNFDLSTCDKNIGNVTIINDAGTDTVLNNGDYKNHYSYPRPELRPYTDFRHVVEPTRLYLDSTYSFVIHSSYSSTVGSNPVKWAAYIDYNQDGNFDTINERIWIDLNNNQDTRFGGIPWTEYSFKVPADAPAGITGMRVVMMGGSCVRVQDWNLGPQPCGEYGDGETEDYLVSIEQYPCTRAADAGTITAKDTLLCPGYELELVNTGRGEPFPTAGWDWQFSKDGNTWTNIANSEGNDTLVYTYNEPGSFRFRSYCGNAEDTAYSNIVNVSSKAPYQCYCYSIATGKNLDSSDVGQFKIGKYGFGEDGPHLNNLDAIYGRTDNTDTTLVFYADSTYQIEVSHILRSTHADAKITLFIDYNNNLEYDENERVWTGISTATSWNLSASVTIPSDVVTDVKTGMRLIINNDTEANIPSDEACGAYVSGETEDFVVLFLKEEEEPITNIPGINAIKDVRLYPNPASGKVFLQYFGATQKDVTVSLVNINGQVVRTYEKDEIKNGDAMELNVASLAQGMYFVRLQAGNVYVIRKLTLLYY